MIGDSVRAAGGDPDAEADPSDRADVEDAARWGVDWWVWRLATSPHIRVSPGEARGWSFRAQFEAHVVLDTLDAIQSRARRRANGGANHNP